MNIIKSLKKSIKLHRISKNLSRISFDFTKDYNKLLDELYSLSFNDDVVKFIMSHFDLNQENYKKLYFDLIKSGGGQYADGHFVAASTLVFGQTLSFCLEHWNHDRGFHIDEIEGRDASEIIIFKLISWFENGEHGEITL